MSEEKLYAVKSDEGEYLDSTPRWNDKAGTAFKSSATTLAWAKIYDGHVVTLIEEPEKVVLTKEQAEIVEGANKSQYPATYISNYTNAYDVEESLLMNAYVNGYTVAKEKKYNVKVPHTKDVWYCKINDAEVLTISPVDKTSYGKFTEAEIEQYGLQDCERVEINTEDSDDN